MLIRRCIFVDKTILHLLIVIAENSIYRRKWNNGNCLRTMRCIIQPSPCSEGFMMCDNFISMSVTRVSQMNFLDSLRNFVR